ncbi:restriction endonuclease S subunit [Bifidobacterium ramosum]|nr:restriction endonuclease S subunit [Bifidobacterium ramosum]
MSSVWPVNKPNVYLNSFCFGYRQNGTFDSEYLAYMLRSSEVRAQMTLLAQGISRFNISKSKVMELSVPTPGLAEQQAIGRFFSRLDALITLHQRKYDKLVVLKKSMLEQMFPREGESVPRIRFSGFTDPWEQRKLGELYENRDERGNDDLQILSVSIYGGVSDGSLTSDELGKNVRRSEDKSLYKKVESGDIVLNMMRAWQGAIGTASVKGMVSPAYIVAKPLSPQDQRFFDVLLRRHSIVNQMNDLSYGVTDFRKRLYWDSFVRVTVDCPSLAEQQAIGRFFSRLDALITLHQRKLALLQNIKKSLLDKMFV